MHRTLLTRPDLIDQYARLHSERKGYGSSSERQCGFIQIAVGSLGTISSILDYGCGRSRLVDWLAKINDATPFRYDPAIPEYATLQRAKFDLIVNTDVLEHIPSEDLPVILNHIASLSSNVYFNIATAPASAVLPNGENAHATVRPAEWWCDLLSSHFSVVRQVAAWRSQRCSFVTWKGQ